MKVLKSLEEKIERSDNLATTFGNKVKSLSLFRVITFLALGVNLVLLYNSGFEVVFLITMAVLLIVFVWLIVTHKKNDYQYQINKELVTINREEINRLNLNFDGIYAGKEFEDDSHPYAQDLDIFGDHSLFQMINRSPLKEPRQLLADWMLTKSDVTVVTERQNAVEELQGKIDWGQYLTAIARVIVNKKRKKPAKEELEALFKWAEKPEEHKNLSFLRISGIILTVINLSLLGLVAFGDMPYQFYGLSFLINVLFLGVTFKRCKELGEQLNQSHMIVRTYLRLIESIENESFESPLLKQIKADLNNGQASQAIRNLDKIAFRFSSRASMFYGLLDPIFMFDYHLLFQAVNWKNNQRTNIEKWFKAVDQMNALLSISGYRYLQEDYVFPKFSETQFTLKGTSIGHPLIDAAKRVNNDFSADQKGQVIIITGSNMSGKSTFERTLGINIVMAQLGAPVCAKEFELYPMDIFISMRTKDNLEESTSSFYAELKRLRQLLDHVSENPVTFYVIDEVLKGTNSEDRHKGAVSLARQLSKKNCFGLISTHDLSLSQLADEDDKMVNYSFNSQINEDKIIFDYKLTPGPCKSFNASKLMENMGIIVNAE